MEVEAREKKNTVTDSTRKPGSILCRHRVEANKLRKSKRRKTEDTD